MLHSPCPMSMPCCELPLLAPDQLFTSILSTLPQVTVMLPIDPINDLMETLCTGHGFRISPSLRKVDLVELLVATNFSS